MRAIPVLVALACVAFPSIALFPAGSFASRKIGVAYRGWRVQDVRIVGVEGADVGRIKDGLALAKREGLLLGRFRRPSYQPETLAEDVKRVRLYFATRGYPNVRVEPNLIVREQGRRLVVELRVVTGPRVYIESVEVPGLPQGLRAGSGALGLGAGDPFIDARLVAAERALQSQLADHGYAAAVVQREIERVEPTRVRVRFNVTPGQQHYVSDVSFLGSSEDLRKLARRTVGVQPGALSRPKTFRDSAKRLQQLQLFRRVELETPRVAPGEIEVRYRLIEREPRTIEAGIGAWADGIIQGQASWAHRNLFHGGRGLGVRGVASEIEQEIALSVWQPSILGPKTRATGIVRGRFENEVSYQSAKLEVEANLNVSFSVDRDHSLETSLVYAQVDYTGTPAGFGQPPGRFFTTRLRWTNDASDDRFYPRSGFKIRTGFESTIPGTGSQTDFVWAEMTSAYYLPLPGRSTWAFRMTPAYVVDYGGRGTVPPDRLFYAGGALSMRGFKRSELGPRDEEEDTPRGGRVLAELSTELRFPLWWRLGFAAFVDAAQVWSEVQDVRLDRLEVAAGPGLAIETPIGPVRGDFGFRLTDFDTKQPDWVFHLYLGQPF